MSYAFHIYFICWARRAEARLTEFGCQTWCAAYISTSSNIWVSKAENCKIGAVRKEPIWALPLKFEMNMKTYDSTLFPQQCFAVFPHMFCIFCVVWAAAGGSTQTTRRSKNVNIMWNACEDRVSSSVTYNFHKYLIYISYWFHVFEIPTDLYTPYFGKWIVSFLSIRPLLQGIIIYLNGVGMLCFCSWRTKYLKHFSRLRGEGFALTPTQPLCRSRGGVPPIKNYFKNMKLARTFLPSITQSSITRS